MINDPHKLFHRRAVVLFNLGGPSSLEDVSRFLFTFFLDKNIIPLPKPFRVIIAFIISRMRTKKATRMYGMIGGKTPLIHNTMLQASALQRSLSDTKILESGVNISHRVFVAMRYSEPYPSSIIQEILDYDPHDIILLPLYPHYSCTTTGSFFEFWNQQTLRKHHHPVIKINDYHNDPIFIRAHVQLLQRKINQAKEQYPDIRHRILFSAHGLPESIIKNGDPYQNQILENVKLIMNSFPETDHRVCYQSKVGPQKWLTPKLEAEIQNAANDNTGVIVVPISFVSDHIETILELDIETKELAHILGVPFFIRVESMNDYHTYIDCLKSIVLKQSIPRFDRDD